MRGLSPLQRTVLHDVLELTRHGESTLRPVDGGRSLQGQAPSPLRCFDGRGDFYTPAADAGGGAVPWQPGRVARRARRGWTASDRAVMSRALRRLVERGLLERWDDTTVLGDVYNGRPCVRAGYVRLTPAGRRVAERLTSEGPADVSR